MPRLWEVGSNQRLSWKTAHAACSARVAKSNADVINSDSYSGQSIPLPHERDWLSRQKQKIRNRPDAILVPRRFGVAFRVDVIYYN